MTVFRLSRFRLVFILISASCVAAFSREVPLTVLHTTDLHGNLFPGRDYQGNDDVGGLLRAATVISRIRSESSHSLLVDCGDFFQGAPESYLTRGRSVTAAMDWLGYDAVVIGNHDFDWGYRFVQTLQREMKSPLIAGNIMTRPGKVHPLPDLHPFRIMNKGGLRIALVGLTTPGMPRWFRPEFLGDLQFERSLPALERIMPEVRKARPDILILLAHMGHPAYGRQQQVNEIGDIAKHYPEFDVILGGHTHKVLQEIEVNGVLYSQAGYHGIGVGRVDLVYDTVKRRLVSRTARVIPVTREVPLHAELESHLRPLVAAAKSTLDTELGQAASVISIRETAPGQSGVQQLLCGAMARAAAADMVLHGLLDDREGLNAGRILERDLWRVVPYDNVIGVAQLTVTDLRHILEENLDQWGRHYFMGVWGLHYELDLRDKDRPRIGKITLPNGEPLHSSRRYAVAMNSFVLASGGNRFSRLREIVENPKARLALTERLTRDALRSYIMKKKVVEPRSNGGLQVLSR